MPLTRLVEDTPAVRRLAEPDTRSAPVLVDNSTPVRRGARLGRDRADLARRVALFEMTDGPRISGQIPH
jgi:hypothetical protein